MRAIMTITVVYAHLDVDIDDIYGDTHEERQ